MTAAYISHKLSGYYGEPSNNAALLIGRTSEKANAYGGIPLQLQLASDL